MARMGIQVLNGQHVLKFSISGQIYYAFGSVTDDNTTYIFSVFRTAGSYVSLCQFNAHSLVNTGFTNVTQYFNFSGFTTTQMSLVTDTYYLVLSITGSDNAAHTIVIQNLNFMVEIWN